MPTSSTCRAPASKSRPISAQSITSPPARSKAYPYTITRRHSKDKARAGLILEPKGPYKGLQFKIPKQRTLGGGSFSAISGKSTKHTPNSPPHSKPKSEIIPRRPTSQASTKLTVPTETVTNVVPISLAISSSPKQVLQRQELGLENWTPITAKGTEITSPLRMKIHRHRRAAVLPRDGTTSLFDPVQSQPNQRYKGVSHDMECASLSSLPCAESRALSPHTPPPRMLIRDRSPELAPKPQRTRPALSLPSRHFKRSARAVSKTVTWDPLIVSVGAEVSFNSEVKSEENQKGIQNDVAPMQSSSRELDVENCVETIKEWGKTDRSKLLRLINALEQLDIASEDLGRGGGKDESCEVSITTVQGVHPRVPDFDSSWSDKAKHKTDRVEKSERHRSVEINFNAFDELDCNKEDIPQNYLSLSAASRNNEVTKTKRRITILDDYKSPGREVDSFADWYAEMQLKEFAKKYPLTGRRSSTVRQATNMSAKLAKHSEDVGSASGVSQGARKASKSSIKREENVSDLRLVKRTTGREMNDAVAHTCRGGNVLRRDHMRPKQCYMHRVNDPVARKNAANIQQRLEVLLLKEKERKALERLPDIARRSVRYADCGTVAGVVNPYYGGSIYEESKPMGASLWIPSERLKLKDA
jgi:hypothetical protein